MKSEGVPLFFFNTHLLKAGLQLAKQGRSELRVKVAITGSVREIPGEGSRLKMVGWRFLLLRHRKQFLIWLFLRFHELLLYEVCKILSPWVQWELARHFLLLFVPG